MEAARAWLQRLPVLPWIIVAATLLGGCGLLFNDPLRGPAPSDQASAADILAASTSAGGPSDLSGAPAEGSKVPQQPSDVPWHLEDYSRRLRLWVPPQAIAEDARNVPAGFSVNGDLLGVRDEGSSESGTACPALAVMTRAGVRVPFEVEACTSASAWLWVLLPHVPAQPAAGTELWLYLDSQSDALARGFEPEAVWDEYEGVWHLAEGAAEATGRHPNGVDHGTEFSEACVAGPCVSLNRDTSAGRFAHIDTGVLTHLPTWTASAWVKALHEPENRWEPTGPLMYEHNLQLVWDHVTENMATASFSRTNAPPSPDAPDAEITDGHTDWIITPLEPNHYLAAARWHHLSASYDGTALKAYVNGEFVSAIPVRGIAQASPYTAKIGQWAQPDGVKGALRGEVDEVRMRPGAFSSDRMRLEYLSARGRLVVPTR